MGEEAKTTEENKGRDGGTYDLHVVLPGHFQSVLKDATKLAFKMELIDAEQISKYVVYSIGQGLATMKRVWYDQMGYK